ncbi:c-type cytochrome [Persicitalea sp.]|uniref:c-type cytochrome n=1 Tax=Persicitalea sp. TaxID=3100273 RepID=UPI0035938564
MKIFIKILKWSGIALLGTLPLVAGIIYAVSEFELRQTYNVPLADLAVPTDSASIREGERLTRVYHCEGCHGEKFKGQEFLNVPMLATLYAPNVVAALPQYTNPELDRMIRHGVHRDGRGSWMFASGMYCNIADRDMGKIVAYLRTLTPSAGPTLPQNSFGLLGRTLLVAGQFVQPAALIDHAHSREMANAAAADTSQVGRGKYIVMSLCSGCHGGPELKGDLDPHMNSPALIVATAYKPEAFRHFLRTGEGGLSKKDCGEMSLIAKGFLTKLTDQEIDDVYAFLQTLPARRLASN